MAYEINRKIMKDGLHELLKDRLNLLEEAVDKNDKLGVTLFNRLYFAVREVAISEEVDISEYEKKYEQILKRWQGS